MQTQRKVKRYQLMPCPARVMAEDSLSAGYGKLMYSEQIRELYNLAKQRNETIQLFCQGLKEDGSTYYINYDMKDIEKALEMGQDLRPLSTKETLML